MVLVSLLLLTGRWIALPEASGILTQKSAGLFPVIGAIETDILFIHMVIPLI